jgi:hypothetical protein
MRIFIMFSLALITYELHAQPNVRAEKKLTKSNFSIDVPVYLNHSVNLVSDLFEGSLKSKGGSSYDVGAGIVYSLQEHVKIKSGLHIWNKAFNPDFNAVASINGQNVNVRMYEKGKFKYVGLYLQCIYQKQYAFIGGGFDISFSKKYSSRYSIFSKSTGTLLDSGEGEKSPLSEYFQDQFDLVVTTGLIFRPDKDYVIKPTLQVSVPFMSAFDTGASVETPIGDEKAAINIFSFKAGINFELNVF